MRPQELGQGGKELRRQRIVVIAPGHEEELLRSWCCLEQLPALGARDRVVAVAVGNEGGTGATTDRRQVVEAAAAQPAGWHEWVQVLSHVRCRREGLDQYQGAVRSATGQVRRDRTTQR